MPKPKKSAREKMQEKYVDARLAGNTKTEARDLSGYSVKTNVDQIERPGGPVEQRIQKALAEKGLTPEKLADEYVEGIAAAKLPGAKDKDLNALAKLLLQLGYLLVGGKKTPGVAIQINNNTGGGSEQGASPDLIGRLEALVERLETQASHGDIPGVLPGDPGNVNPEALPRVGEIVTDEQGDGGGGQP